jgi:hypothetical protein
MAKALSVDLPRRVMVALGCVCHTAKRRNGKGRVRRSRSVAKVAERRCGKMA